MAANRFGIHLPNGDLADDSVFSLGVSHYNMLHMQASDFALRARDSSPDGIIHIRFYLPNWPKADPLDWANRCATEYLRDRWWDGRRFTLNSIGCHVTPANEMNLSVEGGGDSKYWYDAINNWLIVWLDEFQRITSCPTDRIHFPAFAYGHHDDTDEAGYTGLLLCAEAVSRYGILNCHPYWFQSEQVTDESYGHRFEKYHALYPTKRIFCSELGNFNVMRSSTPDEFITWFNSLPPYVIGGTPFIWSDPTGQHVSNDWSRNPNIAARIASAPKPEYMEESMPENYEYAYGFLDLYNQYPNIVGLPISHQLDIPGEFSVQRTTNGVLTYTPEEGCRFHKYTLPPA